MNLSIQCPESNLVFNDGGCSWKQWKIINVIFFSWAVYYRSYTGEVNTAFSLVNEAGFFNASTDEKSGSGTQTFIYFPACVANLNSAS